MNAVPAESTAAEVILADEASSQWIRSALMSALKRDPVDALNDALVLAAVLDGHLRDALDLNDPA